MHHTQQLLIQKKALRRLNNGTSIIDVIRAAEMIIKGFEKGLYPRTAIKAKHAKLLFDNDHLNQGILGSIGRGLAELERQRVLVKVGGSLKSGLKYMLNCPLQCRDDGSICGYFGTDRCPIIKLKILLALLGDGSDGL